MAHVLLITCGAEVREVEFLTPPIFADVDSAIGSFSAATAKYADEDGDLCTLTESTFSDFLTTAQQQGKSTVLRVQLPANHLRPGEGYGCLVSPSPSQCSSIAGDWMIVDPEDARDHRDSGIEETSDIQQDDGLSGKSKARVVERSVDQKTASECCISQNSVFEDERKLDDSIPPPSGALAPAVPLDTQAHSHGCSFLQKLVVKLGVPKTQTSETEQGNDDTPAVQHFCGSAEPTKADMLGISSPSEDELLDSGKNNGPSCEALGQMAGQPIMDRAGTEAQADLATRTASNVLHSCSCKVCCNPLSSYSVSPFEYWACDLCDRNFVRSDPMWACQTATECDWGICKECHDRLQDINELQDDAESREPCEPQAASNGFPPLLAGAIGAALIGPPLSIPLLFAATRHHGWSCRRF
eukprot:TRINITY_DN72367_c0_g1_i1.p1 TRINITY_DN72367_c0_g1~~TRINITY_DN72367_c0_g1_i1.p1  ORF type:complete len:444 (+),score=58.94 TRINITY_DN72367_c0_g1_i1:96-1334(+)